jgi:chaperonin GroES
MLEPVGDNIMAKFLAVEERSKGGLYLAPSAQERPSVAIVIAVGPGRLMSNGDIHPTTIKPGDKILLAGFGGREKKHDGDMYVFLKEEEILAVIKEDIVNKPELSNLIADNIITENKE